MDQTAVSRVISKLTEQQGFYSTRAMRRDYLEKDSWLTRVSKMLLRNIYRTLLGDKASASCSAENEVDGRVVKALIQMSDSDIILDLWRSNGSTKSTTFDAFWNELQAYLHEITLAVDERWHGEALHMPFAVSLHHLRNLIAERLAKRFQEDMPTLPSLE